MKVFVKCRSRAADWNQFCLHRWYFEEWQEKWYIWLTHQVKQNEKELKKLRDKNRDLHKDIDELKEKIRKAESEIEKNLQEQEKKKEEIEMQKEKLQAVIDKMNAIGRN